MKHLSIVFTLFYCSSLFSSIEYPETPQHPVTLQFPGCQIVDPYLWLEEDSDPAVQQWEEEQHALTEQYFSQNLFIPLIEKRLHALQEPTLYSFQAGESSRIITVERPIDKEQPIYYIQEDEESERVELLDVSQLGPFTTIEETEVSPDGRYFAYSITERGNEKPLLKVIDLDTLTPLDEPLSGCFQTNLAWHPNSKGFFYTTFPKGEFYYHQTVLYHEIGSKKEKLILCEQKKQLGFMVYFQRKKT